MKYICFIWINLKIRRDCFANTHKRKGKISFTDMNKATLLYQLRKRTKTRATGEHRFEVLSVCLVERMCKVFKKLVLWPSRILGISVAGQRVRVRTEGVWVEHPQLRQSLKELTLLEVGLH